MRERGGWTVRILRRPVADPRQGVPDRHVVLGELGLDPALGDRAVPVLIGHQGGATPRKRVEQCFRQRRRGAVQPAGTGTDAACPIRIRRRSARIRRARAGADAAATLRVIERG
ncbi:hypothetical protein [Streptomyces sp. NPDC047706]|uniref:hypothetical protein n=1 Tax=Streptomyces sp. NPDC047706 TaxID=3365486 RepID=UPI003710026B